ncbi:AAA family ATPase [Caulobacter sp. CCNWLY153]|uniref:AAA family ATPase n=1 Tax=unclassified Caulobacter TaxID=2648921 RepID=UPI002FF4312D
MILQRLYIENFRQFYGKQNIEFAVGKERNITLIHGFNGAGKTALLNAFVWCLYGETTDDFEAPDRLASEAAMTEAPEGGSVTVKVRLTFKNRDGLYVVERSVAVTKKGIEQVPDAEKVGLSVQKAGEAELTPIPSSVQPRINTLLSQTLYPFFFFNGERVEWLASADAYEQVEEGLKSLLDIKIYERSLHHLKEVVSKELTAELKKHGGEELQAAVSELEALKEKADDLAKEEKRSANAIALLTKEKDTYEQSQRELQSLAELVVQRDGLRTQREQYRVNLAERTGELAKAVSTNGYLGLGGPELESTRQAVAAARQRGELPAKIKPQFVEDLLQQKLCICGRSLDDEHQHEIDALRKWQQNTGLAEYEEAVSQTSAAINSLESRRRDYFQLIDELQGKRSGLKAQMRLLDDQLNDIDLKLGDPEAGDKAVSLAEQIQRVTNDIIDEKAGLLRTTQDLASNKVIQEEAERRLGKLKASDQMGELIKRRREAVDRVANVLRQIYDLRKDDVRQDLSARIARLWNDAAVKDYTASLNEDFQLRLTKRVGGIEQPVHGASTGEKQVLALSFVGSLVEKARKNLEDSASSEMDVEQGGEYPLVMDSPFGSLEDDYRAKVAQWIPRLASQVVILVSKTQWRVEVEKEVRPKVGKEYVLELHSTKPDSGRTIDIIDETYPYVVETTDPYERTQIQLVGK